MSHFFKVERHTQLMQGLINAIDLWPNGTFTITGRNDAQDFRYTGKGSVIEVETADHLAPLPEPPYPEDRPIGFLAIGPGYWGRGKTAIEAARALLQAGAARTDRFYLQAFIGDDNPAVTTGGMTERNSGSQAVILGYFKSLGAYLRNDCPPAKKAA